MRMASLSEIYGAALNRCAFRLALLRDQRVRHGLEFGSARLVSGCWALDPLGVHVKWDWRIENHGSRVRARHGRNVDHSQLHHSEAIDGEENVI
jgi:hypothetical protein